MGTDPERALGVKPESVIQEVPETPEVTPGMKEAGVQAVPTQATPPTVSDDKGQPLIQTPATKTVTIQLPADQGQISTWAKGSPSDSLTWFATFWVRLIKKALHFGWKIIGKGRGA